MPIPIESLREASDRPLKKPLTLTEARKSGIRTAFLCHSHRDLDLIQGLLNMLSDAGWQVYVDWADSSMPDQPTKETARRIQERIIESHYFLFLATPNSTTSRWCPWELGYADGNKPTDQILLVPTVDRSGTWHGNEYLRLYRRIDVSDVGKLGAWYPEQTLGTPLAALR